MLPYVFFLASARWFGNRRGDRMFYRLPPVGSPIAWRRMAPATQLDTLFAPWSARYYGSGTQALAAALRTGDQRRDHVLLPAYGCPDLLSAVRYAGLKPVLIDLAPDRPWMDLDRLEAALDERTRAVIAVNLFGIPERMAEIRRRLPPGAVLIEDAAQALPLNPPGWSGDLVVLSFGRGKPVSLLGGGAVLHRDEGLTPALPQLPAVPASVVRFWLRAALYNFLTRPRCYWLPALLPLGLGETRYRPLAALRGVPRPILRALPGNLATRRTTEPIAYPELIKTALEKLVHGGGVDLPGQLGVPTSTLLRYPLLTVDKAQRDRLLTALNNAGLGATALYGKILPEIDTVPGASCPVGDYPHARAFATRLLTLPLHDRVTPAAAARIGAVIERVVPPQPPLPLGE